MNQKQVEKIQKGLGFIAALDQSGGSTPKALEDYGITKDTYTGEEAMYRLVHEMRTRIITSPGFSEERILGAILFEQTMDRTIENLHTADFLWEKKGIVPFLKVDQGLAPLENGVQLMKPIIGLDALLKRAVARHIFGTKMRSVIKQANVDGIKKVVEQQFEVANLILSNNLIPIIEPEVDIRSSDKSESEALLKKELLIHLNALPKGVKVLLKLSIPTIANFYEDLIAHPSVLRVVALSGGYSREEANRLLAKNKGLIASFSRALSEGLHAQQSDVEFHKTLAKSIDQIYQASII